MTRKRQAEAVEDVTRCVCGNDEVKVPTKAKGVEVGLFVQCDKCHVWQHGYCMGFKTEKDLPERYFCERCRPDLHTELLADGYPSPGELQDERRRLSRSERAERKRRTLNNRENYILQRVLEQSAQEARALSRDEPHPKRRTREAQERDSKLEKKANGSLAAGSALSADSALHHNPPQAPASAEPAQTPQPARGSDRRAGSAGARKSERPPKPRPDVKKNVNGVRRCKPRLPTPKTTINEMRKRISAILEFSSRTQLDMQAEDASRQQMLAAQEDVQISRQLSELGVQAEHNRRMLEELTRNVLAWQEQFG